MDKMVAFRTERLHQDRNVPVVRAQEFHQELRSEMLRVQEKGELHRPPQQAYPYLQGPPGKAFVGGVDLEGTAAHRALLIDVERLVWVLLHPVPEFVHILPDVFFLTRAAVRLPERGPPALAVQLHPHLDILYRPVFPVDVSSVIPDGILQDVECVLQGVVGP